MLAIQRTEDLPGTRAAPCADRSRTGGTRLGEHTREGLELAFGVAVELGKLAVKDPVE